MKRILLTVLLLSGTIFLKAQINEVNDQLKNTETTADDREDGWYKAGTFSFLLNQSAFSNWLAGGTNNIGGNVGLNYDFNYKKGDLIWDNRLTLAYGLNKLQGDDVKKTDDRIEYNSLVGKKAHWGKYWSYSFFLNLRTQFTNGYDYNSAVWSDNPTSGFFKPGYLTFGPGLLYKKNENFKINLAPLTSKVTFLTGEVFTYNKDLGTFASSKDVATYGVEPGKSSLYQLGMYASAYYKFNLMQNVSWENILNLYSNYLNKPQNIDIDYTANIVMSINKYLSTNFTFQTIYDDDAFRGFQVREIFGVGLNYNF